MFQQTLLFSCRELRPKHDHSQIRKNVVGARHAVPAAPSTRTAGMAAGTKRKTILITHPESTLANRIKTKHFNSRKMNTYKNNPVRPTRQTPAGPEEGRRARSSAVTASP